MTDNKIKNEEITKKLEELLILMKDSKEEVKEDSKEVKEEVKEVKEESKEISKDIKCPFKNEFECCKCLKTSELSKMQYDEFVYVESYSMLYSLLVFILLSVSMFIFFRRLFKNINELCLY